MNLDLKKYENNDYIAHYTGTESCLSILDSESLWLTPKGNTNDLYEYGLGNKKSIIISSHNSDNDFFFHSTDVSEASNEVAGYYRLIRQASFCRSINARRKDKYKKAELPEFPT